MTQHLLGVAEIATMLGLSRQRVNQLVRADDFPPPDAVLSAGRIWTREAVESWAATHPVRTSIVGTGSFADFTPASRALVVRSQEEARSLRHEHIGTEHLLLAVLSDAAGEVRSRLAAIGVGRDDVAAAVGARGPAGDAAPVGHIPFTPRAKVILTEASALGGGRVEPAHIARATARQGDGGAAELLRDLLGVDQTELVVRFDEVLGDDGPERSAAGDGEPGRCSFCGKGDDEVAKLIAGPGVNICDECVELSHRIVTDGRPDRHLLTDRVDQLAAQLDQLRRDLDARP